MAMTNKEFLEFMLAANDKYHEENPDQPEILNHNTKLMIEKVLKTADEQGGGDDLVNVLLSREFNKNTAIYNEK